MSDRRTRLTWTVLAVALPGPWTPVIVLAYLLSRASTHQHLAEPTPHPPPPPDPYACVPITTPPSPFDVEAARR